MFSESVLIVKSSNCSDCHHAGCCLAATEALHFPLLPAVTEGHAGHGTVAFVVLLLPLLLLGDFQTKVEIAKIEASKGSRPVIPGHTWLEPITLRAWQS